MKLPIVEVFIVGGLILSSKIAARVDLSTVVWTPQGACAVGVDGNRQVLGLDQKLSFGNGDVWLLRDNKGGKLGGPVGFTLDTDGDGNGDKSSTIGFDGKDCK